MEGGARPKKFMALRAGSVPPQLLLWTGAPSPTFKFVPAPLSTSAANIGLFWRQFSYHCGNGVGMSVPRDSGFQLSTVGDLT